MGKTHIQTCEEEKRNCDNPHWFLRCRVTRCVGIEDSGVGEAGLAGVRDLSEEGAGNCHRCRGNHQKVHVDVNKLHIFWRES